MLDIKYIIANIDEVKKKTADRGAQFDFDLLISLDEKRKSLQAENDVLKAERNKVSKEIGAIKRAGGDISEIQAKMRNAGDRISAIDAELTEAQEQMTDMLLTIPNLIKDEVPVGADENDNVLFRSWGEPKKYSFEAKPHWDIAEGLGLVDFERGVKIAQSRFSAYMGLGAKLERALINFMLDAHAERGYKEVLAPYLVNAEAMKGTGQLPKFEEDAFKCEKDGLYLIPTAEVSVTNLYSQEILDEEMLPVKHCSYSACFRREAGSHGKDVRGLIRQHQFNKVELVKVVKPEDSDTELMELLESAEMILQKLNIPYRIMTLCSGDLGFSSAKTFDIEVWLPSQGGYREISSCSTFMDFQARRASIRFRRKGDKKVEFAHTLNGSGLAVGRTFLAILENYQNEDGTVTVPEALRPYLNGLEVID
ncbi:seryl-tRNA synthetase [Denitrovibrio acetiphilus DSM 12809]|uniref:Serine--tRNA ligase n=1 Tax=Denitrovibrio acetiphilus (strain DSM 12809 / NBRC 114555 / N2460) TaxID=522772 RepID=D4H3N9_DENA2|nr:serine--tRNA ligase [Denitrovibrio acetiphilus]ADD69141.1 seryl-tRNA synthetase [Denitrovibrio acetiphilus DSM 12809]